MSSQVFPTLAGLGWSVTRSPIFMTRVQESISGKRTRIADQSYPRHKWSLGFNFLRQGSFNGATFTEFQQLFGFFNLRGGKFDPFLYQDAVDNAVVSQSLGVGDGVTTTFQLVRAFGGYTEPVLAQNGFTSNTILVNSVAKIFGTDWTIGAWGTATPGLITFTVAPAASASIVASFSYYWPCTFSDDTMDFENFMQSLWGAKKVSFESVK